MKLSQALKHKNRLAGEIVAQQRILSRENSRRNDNPSKVNVEAVFTKIIDLSTQLGSLKAAIAVANVPIYPKIERMAELKARITFIKGLNKREGIEIEPIGANQTKEFTWKAFITEEQADKEIAALQSEIDKLQDEVDAFNATTSIQVV
jgi:hypothetical protein